MADHIIHSSADSGFRSGFFTDEVTYNKIQRHLNDINDIISEEDLRNIKTDIAPHYPLDILNKITEKADQ